MERAVHFIICHRGDWPDESFSTFDYLFPREKKKGGEVGRGRPRPKKHQYISVYQHKCTVQNMVPSSSSRSLLDPT